LYTKVDWAKDKLLKKYQSGDYKAELAFRTMIMTIIMEIWGLAGIANKIDGIILTGSIGSMNTPFNFFDIIKNKVKVLAPVVKLPSTSGSVGSSQIAKAVYEGEKDILGIKVHGF